VQDRISGSRVRIGVSSCLLGERVRYDGGHKRDGFLVDMLGRFVDYVPVCPEVEAGFGVPREAMRLVGDPRSPRLLTQKTKQDMTTRMRRWIDAKLRELADEDLCGFVFKSRSPSSGMERVPVYDDSGMVRGRGVGLFARAFMNRFPHLPVEDEGRLNDIEIREHFIVRIFACRRWKDLIAAKPGRAGVIEFHARHKYLLMAHHPRLLAECGRLIAGVKGMRREEFLGRYESLFMKALQAKPTVKKNVNVLQHMAGYFKEVLPNDERRELAEVIGQYGAGLVPLIVPVTLIRHFVRKYHVAYLADQYYLNPHPLELKLRNHA